MKFVADIHRLAYELVIVAVLIIFGPTILAIAAVTAAAAEHIASAAIISASVAHAGLLYLVGFPDRIRS